MLRKQTAYLRAGWLDHWAVPSTATGASLPTTTSAHQSSPCFVILCVSSTRYFLNASPFWYWCTDTVWYVLVLHVASTTKLHRRNNWRGNCPFIYSEVAAWHQSSLRANIMSALHRAGIEEVQTGVFHTFSVIETHLLCVYVSCSAVSDSLAAPKTAVQVGSTHRTLQGKNTGNRFSLPSPLSFLIKIHINTFKVLCSTPILQTS